MEARKLIAAYCRISTLEQKKNGLGIEIQVRDVTLFARERGLFVDRFYRDEGESGVLEDRPQLKQLLRQCKLKRIGVLIIPNLDRLSRDVRLAENLFWDFGRYDVRVLIADMPSYNNEDRREVLVRQIREAIAEDNRKEIIERLLKGRQERIRKGRAPGGNTPYGYRRDKKTLVRDEGESVIVQTIFAYRRNGVPVAQIADGLNRDEFLRRNGKLWTSRMVRSILSHITLYEEGRLHYGKVEGVNEQLILARKAA